MYSVVIDDFVFKKDFKHIDRKDQQKLIRVVRKKLSTNPEKYGKPLKGDLKGFWKLKVDKFRIVYSIDKGKIEVYIIVIGFRRNEEVYKEASKRLSLH